MVSAINDGLCAGPTNSSPSSSSSSADDGMHYSLEGIWSDLFKLDEFGGMLCIKKGLHLEQHGQKIQLKAIAKHNDGTVAEAQVIVNIEDVNNHSPEFQPNKYAIEICPEMLKSQMPLLRVRAVDLDNTAFADVNSVFGKIHYHLGHGVGTELFEIDEFDGILRLNEHGIQKLSLTEGDEKNYELELRVEAADEGGRTSDQSALINVHFASSRTNCFCFAEPIFHFRVSEETLPGIAIGTLRMMDNNLIDGIENIRLEIMDDSESARLFKFDETNANKLLLKAELDSDMPGGEAHLLNVQVIDTEKNCTIWAQIYITVLDVNDNAPTFDTKRASIKLVEDFPIHKPFYAVKATDRDRNENGQITYDLFETDPSSVPIQIHPNSGILSLSAPLDAESSMFRNRSILLRVRARDHGIPPRHDIMELRITILDVNDNAPLFTLPEYEIEVAEDADLMTTVYHIQATDDDSTRPNSRVRYSIHQTLPVIEESGANTSILGINKWTGEIFLREQLDREHCAKYSFELEARDNGIPSRMARAQLHLRVQDINDNVPVCTPQQQVIVIPPGQAATGGTRKAPAAALGTQRVGRVQASDPDAGPNGTVRFRMQQPNEWFELDAKEISISGDLFLRRPIDFGHATAASSSFPRSIILIAEDQSLEMPLSSVCQLLIVVDQNGIEKAISPNDESGGDGGIHLLAPVQTELWLNAQTPVGTALVQVNATGVQKWSIRSDDPLASLFSISADGTIRLLKSPTTEEESSFDNAKQSIITIQMDPSFDGKSPKYLPFVLRRQKQKQMDEQNNNEFAPVTTTITVPTNWSLLWQKPLYTVENKHKNWTDQHMFFQLEPIGLEAEKALQQGLFVLDELDGSFYMAKIPHPNCADNKFGFRVMARSLSDQSVYEKAVQLININLTNWRQNANHNRQFRCAKTYQQWNISESVPIGTLIGRINILDNVNDSPSAHKFSFVNANATPNFRVDEFDGNIYIQKTLDRNLLSHVLLMEVSKMEDYGGITVTRCAIRINVQTDDTDQWSSNTTKRNAIRFLSAPNVTIFMANLEQNLYPNGNVVHHFVAATTSSGQQQFQDGRITFEIAAGNGLGAFVLEKDGALSVPNPSKITKNSTIFRLTIRAQIGDKNKTQQHREQHFIARIDQSNRKFAYFVQKHFLAEILVDNSLPKGQQQFVAKFKRPDISFCVNFAILPSLEGFKIDEENGTLEFVGTANEVDALFKTSHNLTLTVLVKRCNNNFSSSNKTTEYVPSAGAIDHAFVTVVPRRTVGGGPKIEPTSCGNVSVPENVAIPKLLRIRTLLDDRTTTTDEFTASLPEVVYAIEGGHWHNANLFHIDPNTGWISSTKLLDRETMAEHLLMVSATDLNTVPKKVDMCTVFIRVTDRNDNAPVFKQSVTEQLFLPSTALVGHKLAQFEANDADEGKNGEIHFAMDSDPSEMFDIDWQTGELIFARKPSLSFITDQSAAATAGVWITVKAVDHGYPNALESEPKRIHISWDSEMMMMLINNDQHSNNKTSPLLAFARQTFVANVPEGRPQGQFVAQLNLLNHNGISALSFSILPAGNHDSAFHVDNAGRVSTVLELDAEIRQHYALQVVAVDNANGQKADTWLQINVLDANDNAPFIAQNGGAPIQLMEDLPIGSLVSAISATDADITPTQLEYSLGNLSSAMFEINRWNGKVHLVRSLDFELAQHHILTVIVTDGVNRATTNLSVEVLDVNDNGPQFVQPYIEIELSMDVQIGHILTKVEAIDGDMSKNNSQIRYALESAAAFQNLSTADLDWLHCDQNNGELRLRSAFTDQIRTKTDHFFLIKATDSGQPPLSAYCVVRVTIIASQNNANEPIFDRQNYTFTLHENVPLHQSIGRLTMRRRPFSNLPNCDFQLSSLHFINNNASSRPPKFRIHFDGQIFVEHLLDRESDGEWLHFEASVGNCPPRRAALIETTFRQKVGVQIRLLDINDNAPKFDEENNAKNLWISDSIKPGTLLTRFNATDNDATEENSRLSYHLLAGDNFKQFSIDSASGELRICHWDDALALSLIDNLPTQLVISARDNGTPPQSAEWVVELLLDMNKWSGAKPHFGVPIYRKFVPEDSPVGTKLFNVYAGGRHGILKQQQQNATNDGMMVAQIQNTCSYAIQQPKRTNIFSSSLIEAFAVEPTTGDVILSAPIDMETANISMAQQQQQQQQQFVTLNFTISCNNSHGKIVANVPVEIRVFGIDEFAPTFTKNAYTFKLPSNFDITKPIGQVVAVDRDIGYGSTVRYSLDRIDTASAQNIQINADNGILTMVRWPSAAVGNGPNGTTKGEARVLRFTVWAMSNGWTYGSEQQQHGKRSSATVYIEMGNFSSVNPTLAGDDHSLLSSFDLLSLMVLPTLFLCFCLLSVLVLTRLLRSQGTAASKNAGISNFLRPAAPKKRMFSVATCRELQRHTKETAADSNTNGVGAPSAAPFFSPSVESGLFSYVKRTTPLPGDKPVRETSSSFHHHARSAVPSSARSAASNYVNVPNRTPSRLATIGNGSRRSAPDSGIVDPDTRSLASEDSCAPADAFLAALGVVEQIPSMHKAKQPQTTPAEAAMNSLKQQHHQQYNDRLRMNNTAPGEDAFLDDLIYACMDEIVPVQCQRTTTVHDVASSSNRNNNSNCKR
ncbi:hypothetical protein niasHS_000733 [Heterodera schachtii]|uniref:Cadherin domain-containing protein n=1 Tax=Heterodera schachtii TaxID=97005 RepID=A0ABD2KBB9_HETSC